MTSYGENTFAIAATTVEKVTELQKYLIDNEFTLPSGNPAESVKYINRELSHLWVVVNPTKKTIHSYQTIEHCKDTTKKRILDEYFSFRDGILPLQAFLHPEDYPEYFI